MPGRQPLKTGPPQSFKASNISLLSFRDFLQIQIFFPSKLQQQWSHTRPPFQVISNVRLCLVLCLLLHATKPYSLYPRSKGHWSNLCNMILLSDSSFSDVILPIIQPLPLSLGTELWDQRQIFISGPQTSHLLTGSSSRPEPCQH